MTGPLLTRAVRGGDVSASSDWIDELSALVESHGTLYSWAADQPQPRALRGRAPVYVASVPGKRDAIVVRHAWHGGLLAPITADRFRRPTRAPHEYDMSVRLRESGIPTTRVLGFARYDAWFGLCRVDVVSEFVPEAFDLGVIAAGLVPEVPCDEALETTRTLLVRLAQAGVVHPDLNVKNVLLHRLANGDLQAMIIDVDVIRWLPSRAPADAMRANVARLARSMRKWRTHFGCDVTEQRLAQFTEAALADTPASVHA